MAVQFLNPSRDKAGENPAVFLQQYTNVHTVHGQVGKDPFANHPPQCKCYFHR